MCKNVLKNVTCPVFYEHMPSSPPSLAVMTTYSHIFIWGITAGKILTRVLVTSVLCGYVSMRPLNLEVGQPIDQSILIDRIPA